MTETNWHFLPGRIAVRRLSRIFFTFGTMVMYVPLFKRICLQMAKSKFSYFPVNGIFACYFYFNKNLLGPTFGTGTIDSCSTSGEAYALIIIVFIQILL